MRFDMREGLAVSALLHTAILLVILLGLPDFLKREPPKEETPIAVKLVNLAELTRATQRNPKPVEKASLDTPPPPVPAEKPEPKPDPLTPPPPPAPAAPKSPPPPPPPPPEPPKPAPPSPPPPPPPPPPPTPEPAPLPKPPEPKPEPPKPEPPKPVAKPAPPKPDKSKEEQQFDNFLKNLVAKPQVADKSETPPKPPKPTSAAAASAQPNAPLGSQLTTSQKDTIIAPIEQCWSPPAGARDAKNLVITLRVQLAPDGSAQSVQIVDQARVGSDGFFRAAAESAVRAVERCSPLKVPPDKFDQWKNMTLNFDPKDLL